MRKKKLSRLLEPNLKLYFLCLLVFTLAALPASPVLALAEGADPAEAVELEDGHYVWLPYRAVTARDLEEKNP